MTHPPTCCDWGILGVYSLPGIFAVYLWYIPNIPWISPGDIWGQCPVEVGPTWELLLSQHHFPRCYDTNGAVRNQRRDLAPVYYIGVRRMDRFERYIPRTRVNNHIRMICLGKQSGSRSRRKLSMEIERRSAMVNDGRISVCG